MALIGYHASHEQFAPSHLLRLVQQAAQAGFAAVNSSDHFYPWSERQGQSGFSFAWLGAAMQQVGQLPFGVVVAPGYRYHPAVLAQAIATLCEMFPGRFWVSLGSGEALNERITGVKWPVKAERNARLLECYQVISRLLAGETLTHYGRVVSEHTKLYTLPKELPLLLGAAVTEESARWVGSWADGLITVHKPYDALQRTVAAFREGGGAGKPMFLKVQLSYAATFGQALAGAHDQWRTNIFPGTVLGELSSVAQFDAIGDLVQPAEMTGMVRVSASLNEHLDWIRQDIGLGFERIILHNVNREQERFIDDFGAHVLPSLQ